MRAHIIQRILSHAVYTVQYYERKCLKYFNTFDLIDGEVDEYVRIIFGIFQRRFHLYIAPTYLHKCIIYLYRVHYTIGRYSIDIYMNDERIFSKTNLHSSEAQTL